MSLMTLITPLHSGALNPVGSPSMPAQTPWVSVLLTTGESVPLIVVGSVPFTSGWSVLFTAGGTVSVSFPGKTMFNSIIV
jgi:hypothetical protein